MEKYDLLPDQLMHEGVVSKANFFTPRFLTEEEILSIHDQDYWERLKSLQLTKSEQRASGFPLSQELVNREIQIAAGTIQCAEFALEHRVSMNVAGGTHHAYADRAEGFCLLNDLAIASRYLLDKGLSERVLIVDLDVHQGNGTAKIFENESQVFTFSIHGDKNYPGKKEKSDLDIGIADGTTDGEYLKILEKNLNNLISDFKPDFIFYQSGVDVLATDKLGRLGLTIEGCRKRDELVIGSAQSNQIPLVACMGGGYSQDIKVILEAHSNTFKIAQRTFF